MPYAAHYVAIKNVRDTIIVCVCVCVCPPFCLLSAHSQYIRARLSADVRIRPDVSLSVITAFLYYSLVVPFSLPFSLSLCISYFFFRLLYLFLPFLEMFSRDFMAV